MGRETKILLGLLGTLGVVFLSSLLARLLVPRPPVGLGVDVQADVVRDESAALVEPPDLGLPKQSAFTAVAATTASVGVQQAGFSAVADGPAEPAETVASAEQAVSASPIVASPSSVVPVEPQRAREIRPGTACTVEEGDAWWAIAESAYGDGRWYRGLYAWNRKLDPAVSLRPGTRLVVPTMEELSAAYPALVPAAARPGRGR